MLGAVQRQASLIAYADSKVHGIYPEVMEKTNLHPVLAGPICGCVMMDFQGFNRWVNVRCSIESRQVQAL